MLIFYQWWSLHRLHPSTYFFHRETKVSQIMLTTLHIFNPTQCLPEIKLLMIPNLLNNKYPSDKSSKKRKKWFLNFQKNPHSIGLEFVPMLSISLSISNIFLVGLQKIVETGSKTAMKLIMGRLFSVNHWMYSDFSKK